MALNKLWLDFPVPPVVETGVGPPYGHLQAWMGNFPPETALPREIERLRTVSAAKDARHRGEATGAAAPGAGAAGTEAGRGGGAGVCTSAKVSAAESKDRARTALAERQRQKNFVKPHCWPIAASRENIESVGEAKIYQLAMDYIRFNFWRFSKMAKTCFLLQIFLGLLPSFDAILTGQISGGEKD